MSIELSIEDIAADFPEFRVAGVLLCGYRPGRADETIEEYVHAVETSAAQGLTTADVGSLAEMAEWRRAYRAFGVKKTHYRNAAEALIRRLARDGELPRVFPLVDLYNAISAKFRIPIGADRIDALSPPNAFRYARAGDSFYDLRGGEPGNDPPKSGEVVYADNEKVLCRRWNWRQDVRSRLRPETCDAFLVFQTLAGDGEVRLEAAVEDFREALNHIQGCQVEAAIASVDRPVVTIG